MTTSLWTQVLVFAYYAGAMIFGSAIAGEWALHPPETRTWRELLNRICIIALWPACLVATVFIILYEVVCEALDFWWGK